MLHVIVVRSIPAALALVLSLGGGPLAEPQSVSRSHLRQGLADDTAAGEGRSTEPPRVRSQRADRQRAAAVRESRSIVRNGNTRGLAAFVRGPFRPNEHETGATVGAGPRGANRLKGATGPTGKAGPQGAAGVR